MKTLYFDNMTSFCCDLSDKYDALLDGFGEVSVIVKYNEAKEIIKELISLGYGIASIDLHREEFEEYWDEYIISLNFDGVWCEKFKRKNGYFNDESTITCISNECNSACIPHVKSQEIYAFEIGTEDNDSDDLNESVFDVTESYGKDGSRVIVKSNLNTNEAMKIIDNMEKQIVRINDAFTEMNRFRKLFNL